MGRDAPPLPTSLDVYRELRAVTLDSVQWLRHDLFEGELRAHDRRKRGE